MAVARAIVEPEPRRIFARPRVFTLPKRPAEPNEDAWQHSRKGAAAVSDGASVSFDSAGWSRILVRRYARRPHFDAAWLKQAIAIYARLHDRDRLSWAQQAAFDRGSFASLLGVRDLGCDRVEVLAIGDSLAALCDGDRVVASIPYDRPEQFDARPLLLSTEPAANRIFEDPEAVAACCCEWDLGPLDMPVLLCATDALGRWILERRGEEHSPVAQLRALASRRAFARFVEGERAAGRMRRDDTTLLAFWEWPE